MKNRYTATLALLAFLAPLGWAQHTITTVAGGGPNNLPALQAGINNPEGIFLDSLGNLYVGAFDGDAIYKININGQLTIVAGNGATGFSGDGGPATAAQISGPRDIFVDGSGNIFFADIGNERIREVVAATGNIQTVAGNGTAGFSGDGGPATSAELNGPFGVFVDGNGNIFISDSNNNRIREVVAATGNIQTIAGTGTAGYSGDGALATNAEINAPFAVFVDSLGNIFFADEGNNRVREILASTKNIQTVAGNGTGGYGGDGGLAVNAELLGPAGIFVDTNENIYIADAGNNRVREVVANGGNIQTVAGNGTLGFSGDGGAAIGAELDAPFGVFADGKGNIYIADADNNRVREVVAATGDIQTIAGNGTPSFGGDGGPATSAELFSPYGVFLDSSGNIFIADLSNERIREVVAGTGSIITVAGNGTPGFSGDGASASTAQLNGPFGISVNASGNIFIGDQVNQRIREVVAATGDIQTVAGNGTSGFAGDNGPATSAQLNFPTGVFIDSLGNIFIADQSNNRVREIVAATGVIQTVAGNGVAGYSGDGGPAVSAELNGPFGVFVDGFGDIFIADNGNNVIREVSAATGNIQTVAGKGNAGFSGDGGIATIALLNSPTGVFVDRSGNIFIADQINFRVREVVASTLDILTIAGNGTQGFSGDGGPATAAELGAPVAVFGDQQGNLFVADSGNNRIRKIAGVVTSAPTVLTITGGGSQMATVGTAYPAVLSLQVTDANGHPVSGVLVTFNAPPSGASVTFAGGVNTATTDVTGTAHSAIITANGIDGNFQVGATVSGIAAVADFSLTNNPGPSATVKATGGTPQSATLNTAFATALMASVSDAEGNVLDFVTVTFTAPANGASGTFAGGVASVNVTTNANGVAVAPAFTANSSGGSYNVTATVVGVATPADFALTNTFAALAITTTSLPGGQLGTAYSQTLAATGGETPYTWSISNGALPAGLTLNGMTGAISGTPTAAGTASFTAKVADAETPAATQTANLSIVITGSLATFQVLPQPNTVGFGTSVQFFAEDAAGNAIPVSWSVSAGAGTISAAGLYQAPATGSTTATNMVTATALSDQTKQKSVSFIFASNGLSACCTLPQEVTAAVGGTSNATGAELNGVPNTSTVPFALTCAGLPVGAGCSFTLPTSQGGTPIQAISGVHPKAFCYVFTTGPNGTTTGMAIPLSLNSLPSPNLPSGRLFILFVAGALAFILVLTVVPRTIPRRRLAVASIAAVCLAGSVMGACSGFSPANVSPPKGQVTPTGTFQIQLLATPPPGSGFVQNQLIVPLTVGP